MIPRVFTIPASTPFLPALIRALAAGVLVEGFPGPDPLALATATVYLPTRRACRAASDLFLDALGAKAAVLPRFLAMGDIDEDEFAFSGTGCGIELPPALEPMDRRLLLARLVSQWAHSPELRGGCGAPLVAGNPAATLALADELARLIDDRTTRQVAWDRLDDLVPERFDPYWQLSLQFLKIARQHWPAILAERGAMEPAERRDRLIAAEAVRLANGSAAPVIAAGSTGSMPATAAFLAVIAALPQGAVVLPGLDADLDRPSWDAIAHPDGASGSPDAGHPQFAMQALLRRIGIDRSVVVRLGEGDHAGARLISEAFRPARTTEQWQRRLPPALIREAVANLSVIEAANAEEEAMAIAVALRESLELPTRKPALVTADRALARRVRALLGRWNVALADSRGASLAETPAGVFALAAAEAILTGLQPLKLLALLKHPLFRLRLGARETLRATATLEHALLRGPAPRPGSTGLRGALAAFRLQRGSLHPSDFRADLSDAEVDAAADLIERLAVAISPLEAIAPTARPFGELAALHRLLFAALGEDATGQVPAFAGEDGFALQTAFEEIAARPAADDLLIEPAEYSDVFRIAIAERAVYGVASAAPVVVLGPLEARLQSFDTVVLGGLVEGSWPPEVRSGPWLSRPMRRDLGLDLPERRIGLSAHDFAQCLGAPRVILARSGKLGGAPTVPSRFVQRLAAVAGDQAWSEAVARGERYIAWARNLDLAPRTRIKAPEPKPPREARPKRLSVTDVEHWLRDPYTIYAKHVLRLRPIDPVNTPPGARDRGTLIHGAIGEFTQAFAERLPPQPLDELVRLGAKHFAVLEDYPEARALWWPRFLRIARWFTDWECGRRPGLGACRAECRGEIAIPIGDGSFRLAARADRIDLLSDGRYAIVDYKTGAARTEKQVRTGLAPQLTLEGAILRNGGFAGIPRGASIGQLLYVTLGGRDPAGEEILIEFIEGTPDVHADRALGRFTALIALFDRQDQPFRSLVHPMWKARYGDYDHLARVKEWSLPGAEDPNGP